MNNIKLRTSKFFSIFLTLALFTQFVVLMPISTRAIVVEGDNCGYDCPVIHFDWATEACPTSLSAYTSTDNTKPCYRTFDPGPNSYRRYADKVVTPHSADVAYEKSADPNKCHRPSDSTLMNTYGMNNNAKNAFKAAYSEWIYGTPISCPKAATINAQKVVCANESDLPNWGDNAPEVTIGVNTATDYVNQNPNCHLEPWTFEWAPNGTSNPGDGTGVAGNPWTPFSGSVEVSPADRIWVREQANSAYIPFSGDINSADGWDEVSAEMYCNNDVLNYDNYEWVDNVTAEQNYYCVAFNAPVPQQTSDVTMCKTDNNQQPLSDWTLMLLGEKADTVEVLPNGSNYLSDPLPADHYVLLASGTYVYRPGTVGAEYSDAAYSKRAPSDAVYQTASSDPDQSPYLPWVRENNFPDAVKGWLGIQVNESFTDWGSIFNPLHVYASTITTSDSGPLSFRILDDVYSDNSGSLNVDIYPGYAGITDQDGCITFEDVPYGTYEANEILQDGWTNVDGVESVTVDNPTENFVIVNRDTTAPICDPNVNLVANGDFELPEVTDGAMWEVFNSGTAGLAWLIDWVNPTEAPVPASLELHEGVNGWLDNGAGDQYTELDGDWGGPSSAQSGEAASVKISQDISTIPGKTYKLSFDFSPRPNKDATENVLGIFWGGTEITGSPISAAGNGTQTSWQNYVFNLPATGSLTTLMFQDKGIPNSEGTFLDNVSLYCTEEEPCTDYTVDVYSNTDVKVTKINDGVVDQTSFEVTPTSVTNQYWTADVDGPETSAKWIWSEDPVSDWEVDKFVTFEKQFVVNGTPTSVSLDVASDNSYEVFINDIPVGSDPLENNHQVDTQDHYDATALSALTTGNNTIKFVVRNWAWPGPALNNPGGLLFKLHVDSTTCPDNGGGSEEKPDARVVLDKTATYDSETGIITFNIDWTITQNSVQNFVITDQIPTGLTFVSADVGGTESGGVVTWNLGSQGIGNGTVSFTASLNAFTSNLLWASGYLENNQGLRKDGSAVLADRTDPNKALGVAQTNGNLSDTVIPGSFFSLGFDNGSIVLTFDGTIINGDGNDVQVFETTGGTYPEEKVKVEAWNGSDWTDLGVVSRDGAVDLGSLTHTSAIRLTEQSNKALFEATADGYDLDAVKALHVLPRVCNVDNTAEFTALTNVDNVPISGNDSYNLEINQYCNDPQYDGEEDNGGPIVCETSLDVSCGAPNDEEENPPTICSNDLDDDGDQLVDLQDPGCANSEDNDETNASAGGGPSLIETPLLTGGSGISGSRRHGPLAINSNVGEVLGASTGPVCEEYLKSYIKLGADNDPEEVKKLQEFLNEFMGANLPVTGLYGPMTYSWVNKFQSLHGLSILAPWTKAGMPTDDPTGYVYKTTKRWINILKCPSLITTTPIPPLP